MTEASPGAIHRKPGHHDPTEAPRTKERGVPGGPLPIEFRTLRVGMRVTLLAPLAAAAMFVLAARARVDLGGWGLALTGLAVAAALATLLPWDRLLATRTGMNLLAVWAVTALAMVTVGVWATGGARSPLVLLYALTTVFFAVAFPPRGQVALLAMTLVGYGLALRAADQGPLPLVVLSVLTFLAGFLVQENPRPGPRSLGRSSRGRSTMGPPRHGLRRRERHEQLDGRCGSGPRNDDRGGRRSGLPVRPRLRS